MITYLSGCVRKELYSVSDTGFMLTPAIGNRVDLSSKPWAADTGCYAQGDAFRVGRYVTWLEEKMSSMRDTCLFATAPDVVGDADATWTRSAPVLPLIRDLGYKAALVAQDGIDLHDMRWDAFDALFIGGSTDFKLNEAIIGPLVAKARAYDKYVHMGRVNSLRRIQYAARIGCHSVDGTILGFGPDKNIPRLLNWLKQANAAVQSAVPWHDMPCAVAR